MYTKVCNFDFEKATIDSKMKVIRNKYFVKEEYPMAHKNNKPYLLKKCSLHSCLKPDPLYARFEWLTNELMKLKA
jgi:hypothetical protein